MVLAERYRIVSALGRGGMGEVYRADDLRLGQTVALKFLPASLARDPAAMERFTAEVRIARQVSHPNVVRVFDIGETEGLVFLSMEYVDGEDLASLLRRIGRYPQDKAVQIARQMCAGVAAAHDQGLLHRDLKPANILIDGRGRARVADFGLAAAAEQISGTDARAGTPAYMAPEQLDGLEVTRQSDIYSLGLVLYELFTGRRALEAPDAAGIRRLHVEKAISHPSAHVPELDPLVERVILRCLEKDPRKRPATALQVAAALPGGDPLAAALAAGETPSPEMVAAAGDEDALRPRTAWLMLAATVVLMAGTIALMPLAGSFSVGPINKSQDSLRDRAREVLAQWGYTQRPADSTDWWERNYDFLRYLADHMPSTEWHRRIATMRPGVASYWYRQSPRAMPAPVTGEPIRDLFYPPEMFPGMASVHLDSDGRLLQFTVLPPEREENPAPASTLDWNALFAQAGLDMNRFTPIALGWNPPVAADTLAAWSGSIAEQADQKLVVTAAANRGRLVYFRVMGAWDRLERTESSVGHERTATIIAILCLLAVALTGSAYLARRNLQLNRGDRAGALRLAVFLSGVTVVRWALVTHHSANVQNEFINILLALCVASFNGIIAWTGYIAIEPYVRRRWPEMIISWTRALSGKWNDPLVGRDMLVGTLVGAFISLCWMVDQAIPAWVNVSGETPFRLFVEALGPPRLFLGQLLLVVQWSLLQNSLIWVVLLTLFVIVTRRRWAAYSLVGVFLLLTNLGRENLLLELPQFIIIALATVFVLARFGVLAQAMSCWFGFLTYFCTTLDTSRWYSVYTYLALAIYAAGALWGLRASLGGRPWLATYLEE